jgi:hypothetical protein
MLTRAKELIDEVDLESHPMVRELDMYLLRLLISWFSQTAFTTAEQGHHVGVYYR